MSGTSDTIKGRAKEAVGVVTNNQRLKDEGRMDQATGKVKKAVDRLIDKVKSKTEQQIGDATLSTKVKTALLTSDLNKKYSIHVESDHGTVTLDGTVDSRQRPRMPKGWSQTSMV